MQHRVSAACAAQAATDPPHVTDDSTGTPDDSPPVAPGAFPMSQSLSASAASTSRIHLQPGSPAFAALLAELGAEFAGRAEQYDRSGEFPHANFRSLQRHGLLALTVPRAQGGLGGGLGEAIEVIGAVAKGDPSTALILAMQYLQHARLQDNPQWPAHLRQRVVRSAVEDGALINSLRVEPELGSPSRGAAPTAGG